MALEMRDHCERCRTALPHEATAYICRFCVACSDTMAATCPNCAGDLVRRPTRRARR